VRAPLSLDDEHFCQREQPLLGAASRAAEHRRQGRAAGEGARALRAAQTGYVGLNREMLVAAQEQVLPRAEDRCQQVPARRALVAGRVTLLVRYGARGSECDSSTAAMLGTSSSAPVAM
jgi:hypothetical protein